MKDESQQAVELPLEGRRRWLIKLAAAAGMLPFLS
jgi:hypothetical protein